MDLIRKVNLIMTSVLLMNMHTFLLTHLTIEASKQN